MPRRKRVVEPRWDPSAAWVRSGHLVAASGRHVEVGTELSIKGERGRFRFVEHVVTEKGHEWICVVGGPKGTKTFRFFRPERIRTVHVKRDPRAMTGSEAIETVRAKKREKRAAREVAA